MYLLYNETFSELKKASWPTILELKEYTIIVIIGVALLGLYVGVIDISLYQFVSLFTQWFSYN